MPARILDGKSLAAAIARGAQAQGRSACCSAACDPGLAVILAGDDPASQGLRAQQDARLRGDRRALGAPSSSSNDVSEAELLAVHRAAERRPAQCTGSWCSCRCPSTSIRPACSKPSRPRRTSTASMRRTSARCSPGAPASCRARRWACMRLLEHAGVPLAGRHAVVIGRSNIVGKPVALLLLQKRRHRHHLPLEDSRILQPLRSRPTSWSPRSAGRNSSPPRWSNREPA